ncbi:MAG: ATP-binding protein [Chloroflexia bacterium]
MRGAGFDGTLRMRPVSPLAGAPGVVLVRPLLGIAAAELRAYSARRSAPVQEDPTNQSRVYARNRVRLDVLPLLAEINAAP